MLVKDLYYKKYLKYKTKYLDLKRQLYGNPNTIQVGGGWFEWLGFYDEVDDEVEYYEIDDKLDDDNNDLLFIGFTDKDGKYKVWDTNYYYEEMRIKDEEIKYYKLAYNIYMKIYMKNPDMGNYSNKIKNINIKYTVLNNGVEFIIKKKISPFRSLTYSFILKKFKFIINDLDYSTFCILKTNKNIYSKQEKTQELVLSNNEDTLKTHADTLNKEKLKSAQKDEINLKEKLEKETNNEQKKKLKTQLESVITQIGNLFFREVFKGNSGHYFILKTDYLQTIAYYRYFEIIENNKTRIETYIKEYYNKTDKRNIKETYTVKGNLTKVQFEIKVEFSKEPTIFTIEKIDGYNSLVKLTQDNGLNFILFNNLTQYNKYIWTKKY